MRVAVTGATGMIGRALVRELQSRGDQVTALGRDERRAAEALPGVEAVGWPEPSTQSAPAEALAGRDAVVNLAGEPIAQRWTDAAKQRIHDSRVLLTRNLVAGLRAAGDSRPAVLLSQSAIGWYGPRGDEPLDESEPAAQGDFVAEVVAAWEREAHAAEELGLRVVLTRTGMVLSESGGALERMLPPFKLGVGGPVAGGRQYVPWVHLDDVLGAMLFSLGDERASGPVNVTAPEPVTNREFSRTLGRVLGRPAITPVPGFAVRLLYGQMSLIVTTGQRVIPKRLEELGYEFRRPDLEQALRAAVRS